MLLHKLPLSLKAISAAVLLATAGHALAQTGSLTANVPRVLISGDATFGGCMALLNPGPQTVLAGCKANWVSFSCTGDFTDPVRAYRMLDAAELSLATGNSIFVQFQDDKMHNGYCFAKRIDVLDH